MSIDKYFNWKECKEMKDEAAKSADQPDMETVKRSMRINAAKEQPDESCREVFERWVKCAYPDLAQHLARKFSAIGGERYMNASLDNFWGGWLGCWNTRPEREVVGHPIEPDKYLFQEAIDLIEKKIKEDEQGRRG